MEIHIMKKILLFILTSTYLLDTYSQNWIWTKKITSAQKNFDVWGLNKNSLCDKNGIVYTYGRGSYEHINDTIGSYLQAFDPGGSPVFTKTWKFPFYLHKMEYDGNAYFYFAATFYGTQTIDGITIQSKGGSDAVLGKMDLNGTISWMRTFGGGGQDNATGLCFNSSGNGVFVSGSIADTLFFNNNLQSVNPQSAIICEVSLTGSLLRYKLYDFSSGKIGTNACAEICCSNTGTVFGLMDRKADRFWSNDPGVGPVIGRYLAKLDNNLDTLWTRYLNGPQSYYGEACFNMKTGMSNDIYFINYFGYKYGGDAVFNKLDATNGSTTWEHHNGDGRYIDYLIDQTNTIWLLGNEGANGCPCEGNQRGYYVIKKLNTANTLLGETRVLDAYFQTIAKDQQGNAYVTGNFGVSKINAGPNVIYADSTNQGYYYSYYADFLIKLGDVNCNPPDINGAPHHPFSSVICANTSLSLAVDPGYQSYEWSNGATSNQVSVTSGGTYSVKVTDANGCISYALPFTIDVKQAAAASQICLAGYNVATGRNKFDWVLNFDGGTRYYNIYKETTGGNKVLIDTVNYTSYYRYEYIDGHSSPDSVAEKYFITTVDSCGNESPFGVGHKPILLTFSRASAANQLNWQAYEGMTFSKYYIYRGTNKNNLLLIDSVNFSSLSYSDNTTQSYYYQVQVKKNWPCYAINSYIGVSGSNIAGGSPATYVSNTESFLESISVYPNPSEGILTCELPDVSADCRIKVMDMAGRCVYDQAPLSVKQKVDLSASNKGVYFVETHYKGQKTVMKIVLQ